MRNESDTGLNRAARKLITAALCALLWVAPCAAADGRWFVTNVLDPVAAGAIATVEASPALESESAPDQSELVVLAPGIPPRSLVRPRGSIDDAAGPGAPAARLHEPIARSTSLLRVRTVNYPAARSGRATLSRICLLLI